ncbi:hypothetical protein SNE40_013214 [Patella caerulea]|uniref:Uncharacterized protein n=1 Tax=Patella caerulea TaxID=87958 RepID=A0AAN8PGS0_PATCE
MERVGQTLMKMGDNIEKNRNEITNAVKEIKEEISARFNVLDAKITEVHNKNVEIEKSVEFNCENTDQLKTEAQKIRVQIKEEVQMLNEKSILAEKHDRKYNLVFYGIPQTNEEDINETMSNFLQEQLQLNSKMEIANQHRLRKREDREGPPPIIVKFVHYRDLEAVLQKRNLLRKGQQVLQDLPQVMKQERHKLAGIAYDIRKHEHLKTRIRDHGIHMILETRGTGEKWKRREISL